MTAEITRHRIRSIDIVRGLIMVIMALDHTRDFFHQPALTSDPLNPLTTTPVLYFTRWITHLCAPLFVFLSGTSAFLSGQKKTKKQLSGFLLTRGLWLIFIELTLVTFGITYDITWGFLIFQVIWAIGISMVIMAALIWLPFKVMFAIGLAIMLGHNYMDYYEQPGTPSGLVWTILHRQAFVPVDGMLVMYLYPFLPWTGVMILGYCLGKWFLPGVSPETRKKRLLLLGSGMLGLFVVLRLINGYGDPLPWKEYDTATGTFMSFMNVQKYPPSLMFFCVTVGIGIFGLVFFERMNNWFTSIFNIYGRVPFFYYILHFNLIHLVTIAFFYIEGYTDSQIFSPNSFIAFRPLEFGYPLWVVYIVWILIVAALYPLCRWYNNYKSTHRQWWLSYV